MINNSIKILIPNVNSLFIQYLISLFLNITNSHYYYLPLTVSKNRRERDS